MFRDNFCRSFSPEILRLFKTAEVKKAMGNNVKLSERIGRDALWTSYPLDLKPMLEEAFSAQGDSPIISAGYTAKLLERWKMTRHELIVFLVPFARALADAPISGLRVGAVACGLEGDLYFGANVEFPGQALGFTVHAEQAAVVNAWTHGATVLTEMAVSAPPCGHCRQFLLELLNVPRADLFVTFPNKDDDPVRHNLRDLLPGAFGPADLGVTARILGSFNHLDLPGDNDSTTTAALTAANISYAPYSTKLDEPPFAYGFSGVGIIMADGGRYFGPYCENAAFNPSLSPMAAALSNVNLFAKCSEIAEAALVELPDSPVSQADTARILLSTRTDVPLTVRHAEITRSGMVSRT